MSTVPELITRLIILTLLSLVICLLVWVGRRFIEKRRQQALAAIPLNGGYGNTAESSEAQSEHVRILAFSSADCHQCHQLQAPALRRVLELRGENVSVTEIDAPSSPELTERYRVLTVPTTVLLDATGKAHAVNYGFANTQRLLDQIDAILLHSVV